MKKAISIVIGFTPFHMIPMMELMQWAPGEVFVFHPMLDSAHLAAFGGSPRFLGACDKISTGRLERQWKYALAGREIKKLIRNASSTCDVGIYVPHPFNPLSNYAFFLSKHSEKYIYQDGILNYYDTPNPLNSTRCLPPAKSESRRYRIAIQ